MHSYFRFLALLFLIPWHLGLSPSSSKRKASTSPRKTLFVVTWNSEYSYGNTKTVSKIKKRVLSFKQAPSVVAVCTQEATEEKREEKTLGRRLVDQLEDYDYLDEHRIEGVTKLSKGKNFTGLTLLVHKAFFPKVDTSALSKGEKRPDILRGTKGGVWYEVPYEGSEEPLVIACSHLDAQSREKRKNQLKEVVEELDSINSSKSVLAGDLNFRTNWKALGLKLKEKNKKYVITVGEFIRRYLLSKEGFSSLEKASRLHKQVRKAGFDCSGYGVAGLMKDFYPPTYKMHYKKRENREACKRYRRGVHKASLSEEEKISLAKSCFFPSKDESDFVSLKTGELNLGYLDQVCVKGRSSLKKILQGSLSVFESDHLPVWSLLLF